MGDLYDMLLRVPALLLAIAFHEFAHARMALAFGDDTAQRLGRVTLNPIAHLDPIGTIGMILVGFGWGKPVPVNESRFNHPRASFIVSAAGPMSNLSLALGTGLLVRVMESVVEPAIIVGNPAGQFLYSFLHTFMVLNLLLCVFNMIPLTPLDGSHMVANILPTEMGYSFKRFNQAFGMQILFGAILLGSMTQFNLLGRILWPPVAAMLGVIWPS